MVGSDEFPFPEAFKYINHTNTTHNIILKPNGAALPLKNYSLQLVRTSSKVGNYY